MLNIAITDNDLNTIKKNPYLATSTSNTWLSITSAAAEDAASNPLNAIPRNSARQADNFTDDTNKPSLLSFQLDLDNGYLYLTFNETIQASSYTASGLLLQNIGEKEPGSFEYRLTGGMILGENGTDITILLSPDDLNTLKSMPNLATRKSNTFVSIDSTLFTDMRGNPIVSIDQTNAQRAVEVYPDVTSPVLEEFIVDMNQGVLNLTFSEYVDPSTYTPSQIKLQSSSDDDTISVTLTGGNVESNLNIFTITLNNPDLFNIQKLSDLAINPSNTYISITEDFIQDSSSRRVNATVQRAENVIDDITPPLLTDYVLDLDSPQRLHLTFNEVVNVSTFLVEYFYLQESSNDSNSTLYLNTSTVLGANDYTVTISISDADKERLDLDYDLAVNENTTYLNIITGGLQDMSDNAIIERDESLKVSQFIPDTTGPQLRSFRLNLDSGTMLFSFSEAVIPTTFNITNIKISASPNEMSLAMFEYNIMHTPRPDGTPRSVMTIPLNNADLNRLKSEPLLTLNQSFVFITYVGNTIEDVYNNIGPALDSPLPADAVMFDITGPVFLSFDLDMNTNKLTLSFSETVNISSFDISQITIQNNSSSPNFTVTLEPENSTIEVSDLSTVVISLSRSDANAIKALQNLATSINDTYVHITNSLVDDISGNNNYERTLRVSDYEPDNTELKFLRFDLNLTSNVLSLFFDEPVDISTFDVTDIVLSNPAYPSVAFNFSRATIPLTNTPDVRIDLLQTDVNRLNTLPICTSSTDCYLSFTTDLSDDTAANTILLPSLPVRVNDFYSDTLNPYLVDFYSIDLDEGLLTLTFSETVDVDSINLQSLSLHEWYSDPDITVPLTGGEVLTSDGPEITIQLTNTDLNSIKYNIDTLCYARQVCWVQITDSFIRDPFNNSIIPVASTSTFNEQYHSTLHTRDDTPPLLTNYTLDMNSTTVSLTFNEVVRLSSFSPSVAVFQDGFNAASTVPLTGGTPITTGLNTVVLFTLSPTDVVSLQSNLLVAADLNSTWLTFTRSFISDVSGIQIDAAINDNSSIPADEYIRDYIRPTVVRFSQLSLQNNEFTVVFSEPVLPETYQASRFTLRSQAYGGEEYVFTSGTPRHGDNTYTVVVDFTDDAPNIKKNFNLGTNQMDTYIEISDGAITDSAGNLLIGTKNSSGLPVAIQVEAFTPDLQVTELESFSFDLDSGFVSLTFDDVVNPATFMANEITLYESEFDSLPENQYQLTEGTTNSPVGFIIDFYITKTDLDEIKKRDQLAISANTTYFSLSGVVIFQPGGVSNLAGVLGTSNYTADTTPPVLNNFTYNAHIGALSLLFSETVNISSLDPTGITILNANTGSDATQMYTLTGGTPVPNVSDVNFLLYLTTADLHAIQERTGLATQISDSFLSLVNGSISDMAGNPVEARPLTNALSASDHVLDMVDPVLMYFTFDLDLGLLTLTFSEAVNVSSLKTRGFTISNSDNTTSPSYQSYTLTTGLAEVNDSVNSDHDVVVKLYISTSDLNGIKSLTSLATEQFNTRLFYEADTIRDAANNSLAQRSATSPLISSEFTGDTTDPELLYYTVDLNNGTISLTFTETVDVESIHFPSFSVVDNNTFSYELTDGTPLTTDGPILQFLMDPDDINYLRLIPNIFTNTSNTLLSVDSTAIKDNSNNSLSPTTALRASHVFKDVTEPELVSGVFDLNTGNLTLTFTEAVLVSTLDVTALTLTNGLGLNFTLSTNSTSESNNGTIISIIIGRTDLNAIKYIEGLAESINTTLISFTSSLIEDTSGNSVTPIPLSEPAPTSNFTNDITDPQVIAFNLSMTDGVRRPMILTVQFSETVNITTLNVTYFKLQSGPNIDTASFVQLTGSTSTKQLSDDTVEIEVLISDFEDIIEYINDLIDFLIGRSSSYLSVTAGAIRDTSDNPLALLPDTAALIVQDYAVDLVNPTLSNFTFDLDSGTLSLTWSEPVLLHTLNVTFITLQASNESNTIYHQIREADSSYGASNSITNVILSENDLNIVKANPSLAANDNTTFLTVSADAVLDRAENPSLAILDGDGIEATEVIPDTTRPTLVSFDFMLSTGTLTLHFSESVDPSTVDPLGIILLNKNRQSTQLLRLTGGNTTSPYGTYIEWVLTLDDLNSLKALTDLYTTVDNSYLSIAAYALSDMSGNSIITVPQSAAKQATSLNNDTISPRLILFNVDLDSRQLTLSFSETVNVSSLDVSGITLSTSAGSSYTLTNSRSDDSDMPLIVIDISTEDFIGLTKERICFSTPDCLLSLTNITIDDMSGLPVEEVISETVEMLTLDTSPPSVVEFTEFDLNNGTLTIKFSETVDPLTFTPSGLTLQTLYTNNPLQSYTLTNGSYTTSDSGTTIEVTLSHTDLVEIQKQQYLCSSQGNCYITFTENMIKDQSGNNLTVSTGPGFVAMSFIEDTKSPVLENFEFDPALGVLTLSFTEPVDVNEIYPTGITLQGSSNTTTDYITLIGGTVSDESSDVIQINLTSSDLHRLRSSDFARSVSDTFISIESFSIRDVAIQPNYIQEIPTSDALQVKVYHNDTNPPYITSFTLDLNKDQLMITFSEAISVESVDASQLELIGTPSDSANSVNLTGGIIQSSTYPGAYKITVNLTQPALVSIKTNPNIARSINNTYLRSYAGFVSDTSINPIFSETSTVIQAADLILDTTASTLMYYSIDMNTGRLLLTFNDVIDASTFDVSSMTIQDERTATLQYTLTESSTASKTDGYIIDVTIGDVDLFNIKTISGLATSNESSYLTMYASVADDTYGVDAIAITDGKALQVTEFTPDTDPPQFQQFSLNMNTGVLSLTFSEAVNLSSLVLNNLILYPSDNTTDNSSRLMISEGTLSQSSNGKIVYITLPNSDINELKSDSNIATSEDNTYLYIPSGTITDLLGYELIVDSVINQVNPFIEDNTPAMLLSFTIDMNTGLLNLTFNETVDASTFNPSSVTLQNRREFNMFASNITLTDGSVVFDPGFSSLVTIELSPDDLNSLKIRRQLAIDSQSVFISLLSSVLNDTSGNPAVSIPISNALESSDLIFDETRPELISFDFDRTPGIFTLTFSEVIDHETLLDYTQFTIQSSNDINDTDSLSYTLKDVGSIVEAGLLYRPVYTFRPSENDINNIKRILNLAVDRNSTYLSVTSHATQDYSRNLLQNISSSLALMATNVITDSVRPELTYFSFDLDAGILNLTFSEVVHTETLNINQLTFVDSDNNSISVTNYNLTDSVVASLNNDLLVTVLLSDEDLDAIKLDTELATEAANTYIDIYDGTISDTSGNEILALSRPLLVSQFIPDTTDPRLTEYNISMDAGQLYLLFNEAVNFTSLQVTYITLWENSYGIASSHQLSVASYSNGPNDDIITVEIDRSDLDAIKDITDLAVSSQTTVLSLMKQTIRDMSDNQVVNVHRVYDRHPKAFFEDLTRPELDKYNLDLNNGTLTLSFSETVNPDTINITDITLQNNKTNPSAVFTITETSSYVRTSYSVVVVNFSLSDLNAIKAFDNLSTGYTDTYLSIRSTAAEDRNDNQLVPIPSTSAVPANNITFDTTTPALVTFIIDFDNGNFTLSFTETINTTSVDLTSITLFRDPDDHSDNYTLTGGIYDPAYTDVLHVIFLKADRDEITRLPLCRNQTTCYISFSSSFASDMSSNPINPVSTHQTDQFIPDTTSTTFEDFVLLDLDNGMISLRFEETIDASTVDPTAISLQDFVGSFEQKIQLTGGEVLTDDSTYVNISITNDDLNIIKALDKMCAVGTTDCFIRLTSSFANDTFGNPVSAVPDIIDVSINYPLTFIIDRTSPRLLRYDIDLTNENITLYFDETVDPTTFNSRFITFQSTANYTNATVTLSLTDATEHTSDRLPYIHFNIIPSDVYRLKAEPSIATGLDDTYITIESGLVEDTSDFGDTNGDGVNNDADDNGNPVVPILPSSSLGVSSYTPDSIDPVLVAFTQLDMNDEFIILSFSEPIEAESINFTQFVLYNDSTGNHPFTLTGGSTSYESSTHEILKLTFSASDYRSIKLLQQLAVNQETSYLSFSTGAIEDKAGNPVVGIPSNETVQALDYVPDTTRPNLLDFSLDMNNGLLTMTFDDVIDRETLQSQHITVQNEVATTPSSSYTLTGGSTPSPDGYEIIVNITINDLNQIKMRPFLATNIDNTYLSLQSSTAKDVANNALNAIIFDEAKKAQNYTADTTDPELVRFSIDLNTEVDTIDRGTLTLVFSEAINVTSLNLQQITLQSSSDISSADEHYTLTGGQLLPNFTGVSINVTLTKYDTDNLKALTLLGNSRHDTYLSFLTETVFDMAGNPIVVISNTTAQMAAGLKQDIIYPELLSYCLDMNASPYLEMRFSETINLTSVLPSRLTLYSSADVTPAYQYSLNGGNVTDINDTSITVYLIHSDANEVKRLRGLAVSATTTYLGWDSGMLHDNADNPISEVTSTSAYAVKSDCYTRDRTRPSLTGFDVNTTDNLITLYFSETVSVLELNFTGITFIGGESLYSPQRQLTGGHLLSNDNHIIMFYLSFDDANFIKNETDLLINNSTSYILIDESTVFDMNLNPVNSITSPLQVSDFVEDERSPVLEDFNFDLDSGLITLSFSETVNAETLQTPHITLHSDASGAAPSFTLTNTSYTTSPNGPEIIVSLSDQDLNEIKRLFNLATNINSTFISIGSDLIRDMSDNYVISVTDPRKARAYEPDRTRPTLVSYRLDMEDTVPPLLIILTFSETVDHTSFDITQFTLRTEPNSTNDEAIFGLTGGSISTQNSTVITITVNSSNLESIRVRPPLGHYINSTHLSFTESALSDMNGLAVIPISLPGRRADNNTADLVPPYLQDFTFDLDAGTLYLTFSESITNSTFALDHISLHNAYNNSIESLQLLNSTYNQTADSVIEVVLSNDELNEVKRLTFLATNEDSTYIVLEANVINDIAGNDALPIYNTSAKQVTTYIYDTTKPELLSFDFSLSTRRVTLVFSETVNASSLNPTGIIIVNNQSTTPGQSYRLTNGYLMSTDSTTIIFELTVFDKNAIKALDNLAVSNETLYFSILPSLISDHAGNPVQDISKDKALGVSTFTPDPDRPSLLSFDIDMNTGILTLHFNETVNVGTLMIANFTLQDNTTRINSYHTLTTSKPQTDDSADIEITFSVYDLNEIKRKQFCYSRDTCYIIFDEESVLDMVNMPIDALLDGQALQVDNHINDTNRPQLEEFTYINLNERLIRLSFNETVNVSSFDFSTITLIDVFNPLLANITLTGGHTTDSHSNIIEFYVPSEDIAIIKRNKYLCTYRGNCYISFTSQLVKDMVGNPIIPAAPMHPGYPVMFYGVDSVHPIFTNFTLDMNDGELTLTFNEPVSFVSLDPTGITIQASSNTSHSSYYYTLTGGSTTDPDGTSITIDLLPDDINALKASAFAKSEGDTYISLSSNTITDTAFTPLSVVEVPTDMAIQVSEYIEDSTPPLFIDFTLNLDEDKLVLTFNEPVDPRTTDCLSITLTNSTTASNITTVPITGCLIDIPSILSGVSILTLNLNRPDLVAIKANNNIATSSQSVFLSFLNNTVSDTAGNPVGPTVDASGSFIQDQTRPEIVSFNYNQDTGEITLSFNDVLATTSFNSPSLTLQHDTYRSEGRTFSPSLESYTNSPDGYTVILQLSHDDLLRLKSNTGVARSENDTYLTFAAGLIDDTQGLDVVPLTDGKAIRVSVFTPDERPPVLVEYLMDMNLGQLNLSFSDTVNLTTLRTSGLTILNTNSNTTENQIRLDVNSYSVRSSDGTLVTINITTDNLNDIKYDTNLAVSNITTYLSIDRGSITDLAGNEIDAIIPANAITPSTFIPDETGPILSTYHLDMNTGIIYLTFDETVNAGSLDITEISLHDVTSGSSYNLSYANSSLANSTEIAVYLGKDDIDSINRLRSLATGLSSTYLSLTPDTLRDMNNNEAQSTLLLRATNFTNDTIQPKLNSFDLDVNGSLLTLHFSEVMDYASLSISFITIQNISNTSSDPFTQYTLINSTVRPIDDITLYVDLSPQDLNEIKRLSDLATSFHSTFMSFPPELVTDTFNNLIIERDATDAIQVSDYNPDATPPELTSSSLDLDQGILSLTFDETVDASLFNINGVTLQSSVMSPVQSYTLSTSTSSMNDSTVINIDLQQIDLDEIKLSTAIVANPYLNLSASVITDMNGNRYSTETVTSITQFTPDTTPPELYNYILDLNTGHIILNFTEAVNTSTLNVTLLTLYASSDINETILYQLSLPTGTIDSNRKTVNISISDTDLNAIKADYNLATEINNTYLFIDNHTIIDMGGNSIHALIYPVIADTYVEDKVRPTLTDATFNYNGGLLTLQFSETINSDTFTVTSITLQDARNPPALYLSLSGGNYTMENSTTVTITLLPYDLNRIKDMSPFFNDTSLAFVSLTNDTVDDMNANPIISIPRTGAFSVSSVTHDDIRPEIISFDFDLNQGLLTLYFNEAVNTDTLVVTQLTLQNSETNFTTNYTLTGSMQIQWYLTHVTINLLTTDLNEIKLKQNLAYDKESTYLTYTETTISDRAGNSLIPTNNTEALLVSDYTPDTTPPTLESFNLDFSGQPQTLSLTFSEPVQTESVNFTYITLESTSENDTSNATEYYTLTGGTVTTPNGLTLSITLDFIDVVSIQSLRRLAIAANSTFLSLLNATVIDMAYVPSSLIDAQPVTNYMVDNERPSLDSFTFDANSGTLSLTFTESIDYSSFIVTDELKLHSTPNFINLVPGLRLSGGTVSQRDWYIIDVTLTPDDFNRIRIQAPYGLCTNTTDCYLSVQTNNAIRDTTGLYMNTITDSNALQAIDYIFDVTEPVLTSFVFNATTEEGVLHLTFSEPIDLTSFQYQYIEFHNKNHTNDSTTIVPLTSGIPYPESGSFSVTVNRIGEAVTTVWNTMEVYIVLNSDDFNHLKTLTDIATSTDDTFLFLYSQAARDFYSNDINEQDGVTIQASAVLFDSTHPTLNFFHFDLDQGQIIFTFSESVNVSTLNTSAITLQNSASNDSLYSYTLTGGYPSIDNVPIITLNLTIDDLNAIKKIRGLASTQANTYISFLSDGIYDMAGFNLTELEPENAQQAHDFTDDTTDPILLSFSLNLTTNELMLTFDETVSYSSLDLTRLTLRSSINSSTVRLTNTSHVLMDDSTILTISLSRQDLNRIKLDTTLAIDQDTTELVISSAAVQDMSHVTPNTNNEQTLSADGYYQDYVQPELETFLFDLDEGLVVLNFNEAIKSQSINVSLISFSNAINGSIVFNPQDLIVNSTNGPQLRLFLTSDDLNAIKQNTSLYTLMANAYLNLETGFIVDMNDNPSVSVSGHQAVNFTADATSPRLTSFDFDLNTGELSLTFSETVNASSFNPTGISLQSLLMPTMTSEYHQLTSGELVSQTDDTVLTLQLTTDDLNNIKAKGIALDNTTTWLTLLNTTVLDMSRNTITSIDRDFTAEPVNEYTSDITSPVLVNFTLDLTLEQLTLTFSETVAANTLNSTQFTLLNETTDTLVSFYSLTETSKAVLVHGPIINVTLSAYDLNEIKKLTNLGTSPSNTYLSITSAAIEDRSGVSVEARYGNTSLQAVDVIRDAHRPTLNEFLFDLDEGQIHLTFSETVDASGIDVTGFGLQSSNDTGDGLIVYNLTGGYIISSDSPEVIVQLSFYDLNEVKLLTELASGFNNQTNNTFLTVTASSVRDNDGNTVFGINKDDPLKASGFISDTTSPSLDQYHLDLNTGIITLNFSEAIDRSTLQPTGLTFTSSNDTNTSYSYTLTNGSVINIEQSWIEVNLTIDDLNELKAILQLATNSSNTYLSLDEGSTLDVSGNPVLPIDISDPLPVSNITADTTNPSLVSYTLDMDNGELNLTFTETVLHYTLNSTSLTFQNTSSRLLTDSCAYYTLADLNVTILRLDNTILSMTLNNTDLNELKRRPLLAVSRNTTYLAITADFINDTSMNPVNLISYNDALLASDHVEDTTPPTMTGFDFDLNNGQLVLRFSETVNRSTLNLDYLTFKSNDTDNSTTYNINGEGSSFP